MSNFRMRSTKEINFVFKKEIQGVDNDLPCLVITTESVLLMGSSTIKATSEVWAIPLCLLLPGEDIKDVVLKANGQEFTLIEEGI